ncbi:MAG: sigma-54 dependent transcriptional regulator [Methylobacter sp.]
MALPCILLVDDNKTRSQQLEIILKFMEYRVKTVDSSNYVSSACEFDQLFGIFVGNGINKQAAIIGDIVDKAGKIPVVLLIDKGALLQVSTALNNEVFQVLEWPVTYFFLKLITDKISVSYGRQDSCQQQAIQGSPLERRSYDRRFYALDRLKGNSQAIVNIRKSIAQVAKSDATVLILGESGTGKEIIARALHDTSLRRSKLFVPINCGAIPGELLESELFGHEKGAFTGALNTRQGRFELAEGGTLFLDEIGDMPMTMQVKLLRVLQERTFERVGSNKTLRCDVRVIAATHRCLEDEIKESRFREDLFYRLNVFPIEVSPLRNRTEDIPLLVQDIIACMEVSNRGSVRFTNASLAVLMQYEWPGNIRELANLIERMAIIYPNELVDAVDLPEKFQQYKVPDESRDAINRVSTETVNIVSIRTQPHPMGEMPPTDSSMRIGPSVNEGVTKKDNPARVAPSIIDNPPEGRSFRPARHFDDNAENLPAVLMQLPEQGIDLKEYLIVMEGDLIRQALNECNGVVAHAAKRLNMRRTTLVEKLRKYDL